MFADRWHVAVRIDRGPGVKGGRVLDVWSTPWPGVSRMRAEYLADQERAKPYIRRVAIVPAAADGGPSEAARVALNREVPK